MNQTLTQRNKVAIAFAGLSNLLSSLITIFRLLVLNDHRQLEGLRKRGKFHEFGYIYTPLLEIGFLEIYVMFWPVGTRSLAHYHQRAWAFVRVLFNSVCESKFGVSRGEILLLTSTIAQANCWLVTAPFEVHEIEATQEEGITFHCYLGKRN
jgi:hypothetical protein